MVKCKNCKNFFRSSKGVKPFYWCEKIVDSPHSEMERECSYYKPKTNADRIRSMTDEELARFLINFENTFGEEYEGEVSCVDWLKSESEG